MAKPDATRTTHAGTAAGAAEVGASSPAGDPPSFLPAAQLNLFTGDPEPLPVEVPDPAVGRELRIDDGIALVKSEDGSQLVLSGYGLFLAKKSERLIVRKGKVPSQEVLPAGLPLGRPTQPVAWLGIYPPPPRSPAEARYPKDDCPDMSRFQNELRPLFVSRTSPVLLTLRRAALDKPFVRAV